MILRTLDLERDRVLAIEVLAEDSQTALSAEATRLRAESNSRRTSRDDRGVEVTLV